MDISVILCTYNRCESLSNALGSIAASALPSHTEWEIVVVDNNSKDQTREVVESCNRSYPGRFRYLFEGQQGKSHALNSGIRNALGEVLAFTDDDVTVESTWLRNLTANLFNGEWAGAGGRILPQWGGAPPSWLPRRKWYGVAPLAIFDLGLEAGPLTGPPFGANMAFHRSMFEKYGLFRADLGPRPNSEIRNEDTEFGRRLLAAGEQLRYEATAVVHHWVPQKRLQRQYFLTWWFDKGRADILETGGAAHASWCTGGIPPRLFGRLAVKALRWAVTFEPSRRFTYKLIVWLLVGTMVESHRQSREIRHK